MRSRASRYVGWVERNASVIVVACALVFLAAAYHAAYDLPLRADFTYLLPTDAPAVRDAEKLAARTPARDTMLMLIVAPDAARRAAAAGQAAAEIGRLSAEYVERVESDDAELRAFVAAHRHLFAPLGELAAARDALAREVDKRKNPLLVDLEDEERGGLDELRTKQHAAEARLAKSAHVSADGRSQVLIIRTAFRATDVERDLVLMEQLDAIAKRVQDASPGVTVGFAGGAAVTVAEHGALSRGMLLSSLITFVLVALVLYLHLRSVRMLLLLSANLVVATTVAFGIAAVTVGHLNAATAFLGAIIAGNGVNYGILLVARYLEERRTADAATAMAAAVRGTLKPTLVASLGAAIAYGALAATTFRGFADFAWIGGFGMVTCWVFSFVLLPALVLRFAPKLRREPSRMFAAAVDRTFGGRSPVLVLVVAAVVSIGALVVTARFVANDPFEYDVTQLRSRAPDARTARAWLAYSDAQFGRGLAGLAGQTFIGVERAEQVPEVVAALERLAAHDPIVGPVSSILDVVPRDQPAKLAVLGELRELIDLAAEPELTALRPADGIAQITVDDLPASLRAKLTERDGRIGYVIAVRPGPAFDERDGHDLLRFAAAVRTIRGDDITIAGGCLLFADVLGQIQEDGPRVTLIAAGALIVLVLFLVGRTRKSVAVLVATGAGTLAMTAVCAIAGIKINFLDFVALPITLGLGIDYAINVAERPTASTGGTVLVCSLTTVIGYASLLVSDNLAIRGFGLASLIGEVTCVIAALAIVPAILALRFAPAASWNATVIGTSRN